MVAASGLVCEQISNLDRFFIYCRTRPRPQRHLYHTPLRKARKPGLRSRWWPKVCNRKRLQRVHFSGEQPQKCQHRASSCGATQPKVGQVPTTPRNAERVRRNEYVSFSSSITGFFENQKCDALPVGCATENPFEVGLWLDWVHNATRPSELYDSRIGSKQMSVSVFLQSTLILACLSCVYLPQNKSCCILTTHLMISCCVRLYAEYLPRLVEHLFEKEGYWLREN